MKTKFLFAMFPIVMLVTGQIAAQPFLQLDPKPMYKEDVKIGGANWAGFYRTYDKGIMLIIPNTGNNIQGISVSQYGGTIRFFTGERAGNGITYTYDEFWLGDDTDKPSEDKGTGFMVMKDDGNFESVYCKDGDGGPAAGNFTAGKKLAVELTDGAKTSDIIWEGGWAGGDKKMKDIFRLEKSGMPYCYIGFYTLQGYKSSDVSRWYSAGGWKATWQTTTMPDRTVMVLGIAYGTKLYFISDNRTESDVRCGILTQNENKTVLWSEQPRDKVKKLNEKAGVYWYREQ